MRKIASINQNLTDLTTLVKNLLVNPASVAPGVGEASRPPPTVHVGGDPGVSFTSTMPEVSNSLKNLKPPSYKGEEKDRNKDAMHIFLQKWSDLHALRSTPDEQRALETSLLLEGKAYKWWLSVDETARPRTWAQF